MYLQITSAIQFAFNSCSRVISVKNLNKTKWFTNELKEIKSKLVTIKALNNCSPENLPIINKDIQKFQEYYHAYIEKQRMYKLTVQCILSFKLCGDVSRLITDYL